ncbi:MAG: hypothetical protein ACFFAZ_03410 [Promethearchaeota archaeon]
MKLDKSVIGLISLFFGLLAYYLLAIVAIFNYSERFDIYNDLWTHLRWFEYNLEGALFFRIGNVLYALTLAIFFLSASGWQSAVAERKSSIYLIQTIGISIAISMIIREVLADQANIFAIASGAGLLLTVIILVGIAFSSWSYPEFWRASILFFIISIILSSYLLYMGIIDAPIQEFRIIDFLVTVFNQASIFAIALNMAKIQSHNSANTVHIKIEGRSAMQVCSC